MNYYRCENPDCGFLAEEEPDVCPQCGGTFFLSVDEEELTGPDWVQLGNRAVDEERPTDALACYQQAAALDDMLGVTNLGWCLEEIIIEAEKDTELWIIPADVYKNIMNESAPAANYTNELMASRFSDVMWLIEQIMWKSLDKRVAAFLLEEAAIEGTYELKITHETPPRRWLRSAWKRSSCPPSAP